jgi:hypothetical protein
VPDRLRRCRLSSSRFSGLFASHCGMQAIPNRHDSRVRRHFPALLTAIPSSFTRGAVYTQILDGAARATADRVGSELFRIVTNMVKPLAA